ncbi:hypothetical protein BH11ARM2_BH11ARM2_38270 [soil metagenome]
MADDGDWIPLGVAAAMAKEYAAEGRDFMPTLVRLLETALPDETVPIEKGGFLSKRTTVGVRLTLGDFTYEIDGREPGPLRVGRTHVVRGIALKSEPIDIDAWLAEVGAGIEARMRASSKTTTALNGLLGL